MSPNISPADAFRLLDLPDHASNALLRLINEIQKLHMDMGMGRDDRPVYVRPGYKTELPAGFRTRLLPETLDYGADSFGGPGKIPASVFCAICGDLDLLNLPGFDVAHLRLLNRAFNRTVNLDAEDAINEAQSILRSIEPVSAARDDDFAALEFTALLPRERFVYLIQKQDDLRDFLDTVENFPEMLAEDDTKAIYRRTVAPLYRFDLGDDRLGRDTADLLSKIKDGMLAKGPKADILPFRKRKTPTPA